jgi:integral membrane protein (TIGR01906 family)
VAVLVLAGPLALFNPWFVSLEQARNGVPARLATSQADVDRVTGGILCDLLFSCDDFGERIDPSTPLLSDAERSHLRDVAHLVRVLGVVVLVALALVVGVITILRWDRRRVGTVMLWTGAGVGAAAIVAGGIFAFAFDQAFLAFHELFFPQGNFLFGPDSNLLRLFPEGFWFESSIAAGVLIFFSCLAVSLIGWRLARN